MISVESSDQPSPSLLHLAILYVLELCGPAASKLSSSGAGIQAAFLTACVIRIQEQGVFLGVDLLLRQETAFFSSLHRPFACSRSLKNAMDQCVAHRWLVKGEKDDSAEKAGVFQLTSGGKQWLTLVGLNPEGVLEDDLFHKFWEGDPVSFRKSLVSLRGILGAYCHNVEAWDARELLLSNLKKVSRQTIWGKRRFSEVYHLPEQQWRNAWSGLEREEKFRKEREGEVFTEGNGVPCGPSAAHLLMLLGSREYHQALKDSRLLDHKGWCMPRTFHKYLFVATDELRRKGCDFGQFVEILKPESSDLSDLLSPQSFDVIIAECRMAGWLEAAESGDVPSFPRVTPLGLRLLVEKSWNFCVQASGMLTVLELGDQEPSESEETIPLMDGLIEETMRVFAKKVVKLDHPGELFFWIQKSAQRIRQDCHINAHLRVHEYYQGITLNHAFI